MSIDRPGLAAFLRTRREALQPEDVGVPRGRRRRTGGLRREEVAALSHVSADYYARIEQQRGPRPSEQTIASIAQGLHLSLEERDHLFRLGGYEPPRRGPLGDHIPPGMLRIFERVQDSAAEIVTELGETLLQSPRGKALAGDLTAYTGAARSIGYRWFTDPSSRERYAADQHGFLGRLWASGLREVSVMRGPDSYAAELVHDLLSRSEEFRQVWDLQEVGLRANETKRFMHPQLGELDLTCQTLVDPHRSLSLLVYAAVPGSVSHERMKFLDAVAS